MRLGLKLALTLIPLVTLPLLVVGSVSYFKLLDSARQDHFTKVRANLEQTAAQLETLIENARSNSILFAENQQLHHYLLTDDESIRYDLLYRPLLKEFINIQKAFPQYYELRLILPDGFEDLRSTSRNIPNLTEEESQTVAFQQVSSAVEPLLSRIERNPDTGEVACYIYKRISLINPALDDAGKKPSIRGFLSLTADLKPIQKTISEYRLGTSGGLLLTDATGQVLLASPPLEKFRHLTQLSKEPLPAPQYEPRRKILAEHSYYHASLQLRDNLQLHALLPEQSMLQASHTINRIVTHVTLISLFAAVSLTLLFLRSQLLKPIHNLQQAVARLGQGEELVQLEIDRTDELGELSNEFNRMSLTLKKSNDQIRNMAFCDNLTQLPNRFMFNRNLKRIIEVSRKEKTMFALLYLDLVKFKQVNDTAGHLQGDAMLREIAKRVANNLRGSDMASRIEFDASREEHLSRLGGDEFTVLLPDIKTSINAAKAAERLIALIEKPVQLAGQEHSVSVSIGIAIYPEDGTSSVELIKNADLAMYEAKKLNKGAYEFFSQHLSQQVLERTRLEQRLIKAVDEMNFEVHYQPILDEQNLHIYALEALIRWHDEELGAVGPDLFIPTAEDIGLINKIGEWVLTKVCRQIRNWNSQGIDNIKVAINISSHQFEKKNFAAEVLRTLNNEQVAVDSIYLELTESTLIQENNDVLANLIKLRQHGIKIALDDFGTGYSSLSYLRNLPIDILKIDRSFIQGLNDKNNSIILSAMITMAHALGMQVVAEGIEEQGQFAFLKKESCDFLQGYLFSRPEPATKITKKLLASKELKSEPHDINRVNF